MLTDDDGAFGSGEVIRDIIQSTNYRILPKVNQDFAKSQSGHLSDKVFAKYHDPS